eukprot:m.506354 g.506354  ORF g.506354 m.506354 type:complete len:70 (+) comp81485_c0_seq1:62-271(+)
MRRAGWKKEKTNKQEEDDKKKKEQQQQKAATSEHKRSTIHIKLITAIFSQHTRTTLYTTCFKVAHQAFH